MKLIRSSLYIFFTLVGNVHSASVPVGRTMDMGTQTEISGEIMPIETVSAQGVAPLKITMGGVNGENSAPEEPLEESPRNGVTIERIGPSILRVLGLWRPLTIELVNEANGPLVDEGQTGFMPVKLKTPYSTVLGEVFDKFFPGNDFYKVTHGSREVRMNITVNDLLITSANRDEIELAVYSNPKVLRIRGTMGSRGLNVGFVTPGEGELGIIKDGNYLPGDGETLDYILSNIFPGIQYDRVLHKGTIIAMTQEIREVLVPIEGEDLITLTLLQLAFPVEPVPGAIEIIIDNKNKIFRNPNEGFALSDSFSKLVHYPLEIDMVEGLLSEKSSQILSENKIKTKMIQVNKRKCQVNGVLSEPEVVDVTLIAVPSRLTKDRRLLLELPEAGYHCTNIDGLI